MNAAKLRAELANERGGDALQVLLGEWHSIEELALDAERRGVLSKQQLAVVFIQMLSDAVSMLPPDRSDIFKALASKARSAHTPTYEGFLKRDKHSAG